MTTDSFEDEHASARRIRGWRKETPILALLCVIAALLRFFDIDGHSFWLDEAMSVHFASLPIGQIIGADTHPPLYYVVLHFWLLLGESDGFLRSLSVVTGLMTVPVVYAIGRTMGGPLLALVATLLFAISPLNIEHAQNARMYPLMTFGAAIATWGLVQIVSRLEKLSDTLSSARPENLWWPCFAYVCGCTLALYSHHTAFTIPLAANVGFFAWYVVRRCQNRRLVSCWVAANAIVLAIWAAYWPWMIQQVTGVVDNFWISGRNPDEIAAILRQVHFGNGLKVLDPLPALLFGALLGLAVWRCRQSQSWLVVVALLIVPPMAELAVGLVRPIFIPRTLLWTSVPFYLLAAGGVTALRPAVAAPLLAAAAIILGAGTLDYHRHFLRQDWREAARVVAAEARQGDLIVFGGRPWDRKPFEYYYGRYAVPMPTVPDRAKYFSAEDAARVMAEFDEERRLWLLEPWDVMAEDRSESQHLRALFVQTSIRQTWDLHGLNVYLIERPN